MNQTGVLFFGTPGRCLCNVKLAMFGTPYSLIMFIYDLIIIITGIRGNHSDKG
jgi:hypothetical protein